MALAIERYLKDFGKPETFVVSDDIGLLSGPSELPPIEAVAPEPSLPVAAPVDLEAEVAEAMERGRAEGAEAAEARLTEAFEEERGRHRDEINELRTRYEQDFSTVVASRYDALCDELVETVGAQVTRILAPVFEQSLSEQMVTSLAEAIRQTMKDRSATVMTITGPASVFDNLKNALGDDAAQLEFIESDEFDLTVRIDDAVLCTRLSEWAGRLREVLP
ncbi:hypothetical protein [Hoeflea poritis]|uniref:Flagellar assembly protein FliH/Type III secretion system HrpE domain-containing protein n=1 Tax=Hoeflea poritis TaxID=2993659 RepID=A0ABT4VTM0_9HYPH|nr:hypothetical protein [Hoeflea poritis]MDA4847530.1 hypothetical protein [Hoeflea poritis]